MSYPAEFERETLFTLVAFDDYKAMTKEYFAKCFIPIESNDLTVGYIFGGTDLFKAIDGPLGNEVSSRCFWSAKVIIQDTLPDNYVIFTPKDKYSFMPQFITTEFEDLPLLIGRTPKGMEVYDYLLREMLFLGDKKKGMEKYISEYITRCHETDKEDYGWLLTFFKAP